VKKWILLFGLLIPSSSHAQSYSINWYKVAGGGGVSVGTNGASVYSVSGTIGQQDASSAMTGGTYSLTGGFWSLISVLQTPGVPNLSITEAGNSVIVSWPNTGSYTLHRTTIWLYRQAGQRVVIPSPLTRLPAPTASPSRRPREAYFSVWLIPEVREAVFLST